MGTATPAFTFSRPCGMVVDNGLLVNNHAVELGKFASKYDVYENVTLTHLALAMEVCFYQS